jgi:hypothetical protein
MEAPPDSLNEKVAVRDRYCTFYLARTITLALVAACWLGLRALPAAAQEGDDAGPRNWKVLTYNKARAQDMFKIRKILAAGSFETADEEKMLVNYYQDFALPRWTAPEFRIRKPWIKGAEQHTDVVGELRIELQIAEKAPAKQVYERLCALLLEYLPKELIGDSDIEPVVRFNAMAIVGELRTPEAPAVLLKTIKDKKQIDAVRVAALQGLAHQAASGGLADAESQRAVSELMLKLVVAPLPSTARADGLAWMRGQAAEILGLLGSTGNGGAVVAALTKMIDDKSLPQPQRCKAARALGQLTYSGQVAVDSALQAAGRLADEILELEKERENVARARLKGDLLDVRTAILGADAQHTGLSGAAANAADRKLAAGIMAAIKRLTDEPIGKLTAEELAARIDEAKSAVDNVVKK